MQQNRRLNLIPLAVTLAAASLFAGCPSVQRTVRPVQPPTVQTGGEGLSTPHEGFFRHSLQLSWAGDDLSSLAELSVLGARDVEVRTTTSPDLQLRLTIDVQKTDHDRLSREYEAAVRSASRLDGDQPRFVLPASSCHETAPAQITGLCIRRVVVRVPVGSQLSLRFEKWTGLLAASALSLEQLVLDPGPASKAELSDLRADVAVIGGGAEAELSVRRLGGGSAQWPVSSTGALTVQATQLKKITLAEVRGRVSIRLDNPAGTSATDDGIPITQFPYERGTR